MEPFVKFWMVYRLNGGVPRVQHLSKIAAQDEAKRLAGSMPGETFVVLSVVDAFKAPIAPVESIPLRKATPAEVLDSEIPF